VTVALTDWDRRATQQGSPCVNKGPSVAVGSGSFGGARKSGRAVHDVRQALFEEIEERLNDVFDGPVEASTAATDMVEISFANRLADGRHRPCQPAQRKHPPGTGVNRAPAEGSTQGR
jgi:hypothetical protein